MSKSLSSSSLSFSPSSSPLNNLDSPYQTLHHKLTSTKLSFPPNSRWTKQSFASECDINTLMARYQSTGEIPNLNTAAPQYLDATVFDFHQMQNQVVEAQNLFDELPSKLRARFLNDPGLFLEFVGNPENRAEMASLGLLKTPTIASGSTNDPVPIPDPQPKAD